MLCPLVLLDKKMTPFVVERNQCKLILYSFSLWIIQVFALFVRGLQAKQNHKKGGECERLLASGREGEMTPLVGDKDSFMVLV